MKIMQVDKTPAKLEAKVVSMELLKKTNENRCHSFTSEDPINLNDPVAIASYEQSARERVHNLVTC